MSKDAVIEQVAALPCVDKVAAVRFHEQVSNLHTPQCCFEIDRLRAGGRVNPVPILMNLRIALDPGPYVSGHRFRELGALVVIRRGVDPNQIAYIAKPLGIVLPAGGEITAANRKFVERDHTTGEDRKVGVRPRGRLASQTQRQVIAEDPPELRGASFVVAHHAAIVEKDGFDLVQVD